MTILGIDKLLVLNPAWKTKRIGLVTNQAAVTSSTIPTRKALLDAGFNIILLFSPEHGITTTGEDGAAMKNGVDELTNLPVTSLYGDYFMPSMNDLELIDFLLFDIPDAGVRFYTYLWTMTYCLEVCGKVNKPFVLLDRPNPISGQMLQVEGPLLTESTCSSFIGRWNIPIRHSCTFGELASFFNSTKNLNCPLKVITCQHWTRDQYQSDTGLHFTPTSPAIHDEETLILYPGTCFLEATNLYEGRGSKDAFKVVGAPWLKADTLINALQAYNSNEINYSTTQIVSASKRFKNERCNTVKFEIIDNRSFQPVRFGLILLKCIKEIHAEFKWDLYPTSANPSGEQHLDKLLGIYQSTDLFDIPWDQFLKRIELETNISNSWSQKIKPFLLYS